MLSYLCRCTIKVLLTEILVHARTDANFPRMDLELDSKNIFSANLMVVNSGVGTEINLETDDSWESKFLPSTDKKPVTKILTKIGTWTT